MVLGAYPSCRPITTHQSRNPITIFRIKYQASCMKEPTGLFCKSLMLGLWSGRLYNDTVMAQMCRSTYYRGGTQMRSTFLRRLLVVIIGLIPLAGIVTSIAAPSVASAGGTPPPQAIFQGQPGCNTTQYSYPGHQRVVYNLVTSDVASGYVADASITKLAPQEALVYGPGSDQLTPNTTWTFVEDGINNSSPQAEIEVHIVWSGAGLPTVTKDLDAVVPLAGNCPLTPPMANPTYVGMATTNGGYWLARSDGRVVAWGTAKNYGDMYNRALNAPIVGIAATADGKGYWLLAGDGGIFSFGDAVFHGSTGNIRLNKPVVGMTTTKTGNGYWLVASDGGIFSFGDAVFYGSTGNIRLNKPVVGMSTTLSGNASSPSATRSSTARWAEPRSTHRRSAWLPIRVVVTGSSPAMEASSPSAGPVSTAPLVARTSSTRSAAWPRLRPATVTG